MEKGATMFSCPTGVQIQVTREQSLTQGRVRVQVRSGQKPEGPAATGRRCRFCFAIPCLLLFAASLLGSGRAADRYMIQNWTIEKGLPSDSATAIAQTRDGFIWIGCEEGLARVDGLRMEVFNRENTPALQNHYIRSLCPDGENGLWIGTFAGELLHYHEGRFDKLWQSTRTGGKSILFIAREIWERQRIPCLFISAFSAKLSQEMSSCPGFLGMLPKPLNEKELSDWLKHFAPPPPGPAR